MTSPRARSRRPPKPSRAERATTRPPKPSPASRATGGSITTGTRLAWFLAGVLVVKFIVVWQLKDHILLQPDTTMDTGAYLDLAKQVISGNWALGPGLYYVSPLYIYILAFVDGPTGSLTAVRVVQILLGTAGVGCIFLAAREWFGERAAWIAATLAALTGVLTFYEAVLLQSSLDAALTAAALMCLTFALARGRASWFVLAGAAFGVMALNRPNAIVAPVVVAVALIAVRRVRPAIWLAAGLALSLAPATIRNVVVAGEWSPLSSQGGLNFYIGNNDSANGFYVNAPGVPPTIEGQRTGTRAVAEAALGRPLTDTQVSNYFFDLGWTWIRQHPDAWVRLFLRKALYLLNSQHTSLPLSYPFYAYDARTFLRVLAVGTGLLAPLGLAGLLWGAMTMARERRAAFLVWLAFVPAYFLSVIVFFVAERYRLPLLIPYAIGAGAAVDAILRAASARPIAARPLAAIGIVAIAAGVAANWPLGIRDGDGRSEERVHMAENLARKGRVEEAERWLAQALPGTVAPGMAQYRVGLQLVNASQYAPAVAHLTAALEARPGEPHAEFALGEAFANSGRVRDAIPHFERAMSQPSDLEMVGYDLAVAYMQIGDLASATRILRGVRPPATASAETWIDLGRFGLKINAPDVAEPLLQRAVELAPAAAPAHGAYGISLLMQRKYDRARRELETALTLDPRDAESAANLAYVELQQGQFADARTHADLALHLDPRNAVAQQVSAALAHVGR